LNIFRCRQTSLWLVALSLALSHGRGNRFLLRVRGCEYSIISCRIYNEINEKIVPWTLFIIFLISIPILYILSIEKVRFDITNDFNSNKTIICKVHDIKIEVSKADGWIIDDSYKFVKGPTRLIISRCETKE